MLLADLWVFKFSLLCYFYGEKLEHHYPRMKLMLFS